MTPAPKQLLLAATGPEPNDEERHLLALAEWMGVGVRTVPMAGLASLLPLCAAARPGTYSLAASAQALAAETDGVLMRLLNGGGAQPAELLVFGWTAAPAHQRALRRLTGEALRGTTPLDPGILEFSLPAASAPLSRQLAGLDFTGSYEGSAFAFEDGRGTAEVETILTAGKRPVFVCLRHGSSRLFLLGAPLPRINQPLSRRHGLEEHYAALVAPLIFLRDSFPQSFWQAPRPTARLIIDDPVLSMRYGFLDFQRLRESMQRCHYGTSIAFIPWNGWRTNRQNARRLLSGTTELSICVHGCDHSNLEFQTQDAALLDTKARLAMERMLAHQKRTGAAFEPVMVFPQGRFSQAAPVALRMNGFLAAVNSTVIPVDHETEEITVGDLLRPAMMRCHGFPIFGRHYPRHLFPFAFDLFLGKPALIAEHHQYFRHGFETIEAFVERLYGIEPRLCWPALDEQLASCCLQKLLPDGTMEILFFTRRFLLPPAACGAGQYMLRKAEPRAETIAEVRVDGAPAPFSVERGELRIEIMSEPEAAHEVEIVDRRQPHPAPARLGAAYKTRVALRRRLSELRDNVLARDERLLKAARRLARAFKATGDA